MLVVGDDPELLRCVELGLGHFGHLISSVRSVGEAVAHFEAFYADVVVCELRLLCDAGRSIVRAARGRNAGARMIGVTDDPLLLLSTSSTQFDRLLLRPVDCVELDRLISPGVARV